MTGLSLVVRSVLLTVFYHPYGLLPERGIVWILDQIKESAMRKLAI